MEISLAKDWMILDPSTVIISLLRHWFKDRQNVFTVITLPSFYMAFSNQILSSVLADNIDDSHKLLNSVSFTGLANSMVN